MKSDFQEYFIDAELQIKTTGRNDDHSDTHRYPYEPTQYRVLDRILEEGYMSKEDTLLDFGCGKGRVPLYFYKKLGCRAMGVEFVEEFFRQAVENADGISEVAFFHGRAEDFTVPNEVCVCFFFNPFDVGILRGVMKNLLSSYYECPRGIKLFFYYPSDEYIAYLSTVEELMFIDEIDCMDLFEQPDERNRVMVFALGCEELFE